MIKRPNPKWSKKSRSFVSCICDNMYSIIASNDTALTSIGTAPCVSKSRTDERSTSPIDNSSAAPLVRAGRVLFRAKRALPTLGGSTLISSSISWARGSRFLDQRVRLFSQFNLS